MVSRNRRRVCLICVVCCVLLGCASQQNGIAQRSDTDAIQQLEERWVRDLDSGNAADIAEILADDFQRPAPTAGRFIDRAALLQYYRAQAPVSTGTTRRIETMNISFDGGAAIARGVVIVTTAATHRQSRLLFTDVFVRRANQWRAVSAQENEVSTPDAPPE